MVARQLRVEYAGAIYHVMNRGDRREPIFQDDGDRQRFVETLGERNEGDREKVKIAARLRNETLMTVAWIAQRLQMGSVANVNTLLYQWRQKHRK